MAAHHPAEYFAQSIVDPNAVIPIDYQASVLDTKDGRTVVGIVKKQDDTAVTIVTNTETLVVPLHLLQEAGDRGR